MWHEARKQEKKIRGMMVDYKRRAERRRDFYEKIKQDPAQFLQVHGRPAKIHLDPAVAMAADSPATMMPWQGHADNLIDRFDVRAHLDIIPEYKQQQPPDVQRISQDEDDRKISYERYRTLVQNDFLGVKEDKFLHQIFMEERYGIFKPSCEEEKKRLIDKKAAIGYVYEDSTESPPHASNKNSDCDDDDENEEEKEEDLEDIDLDVTVDVNVLEPSQCREMNEQSVKYGMVDDDFITYLLQDKDEAEQLRLAREIEEEKAMYSGRKSRRERRALREKKLAGRIITSPPSYAARDSPTYVPIRHSASKSRSRSQSPPDAGKIMFITSFGDEGSDGEKHPKLLDKSHPSMLKHGKSSSKLKDSVIGPQLPNKNGDDEKPTAKVKSSKRRISSDSSLSKLKVSTSHKDKYRRSKKSRSRSSSGHSFRKESSKSKKHSHKSKSRSRSPSLSPSRSRSRSHNRSHSAKTKSRSKSKSRSRSRSRSKAKASLHKSNTDTRSDSPNLPPPPVKSYYRHSLSRSNSEFSSNSDDDRSSTKSSNTSFNTTSKLQQLMGKAPSSTKAKLTPQERLKRKMQLQLKKQYKLDKQAQIEKTEKQLQEQQDRAEELREMAIKLRQRERERRHRMRGGYSSDSDSTWTRNPDYVPRLLDDRPRRHDPPSSDSMSSHSSERELTPPPSTSRKHTKSKSPPLHSSRRSPPSEKRHVSPPYRSSRRSSPPKRSPRRSPNRSSYRSPVRGSYGTRDIRDVRRSPPRRRSRSRSPARQYSRNNRQNSYDSRSKSPVPRSYSSRPLVDY